MGLYNRMVNLKPTYSVKQLEKDYKFSKYLQKNMRKNSKTRKKKNRVMYPAKGIVNTNRLFSGDFDQYIIPELNNKEKKYKYVKIRSGVKSARTTSNFRNTTGFKRY